MSVRLGFGMLLLLFALDAAAADINRCVDPDGVRVYTDRSCESLGIADESPRSVLRRRLLRANLAQGRFVDCAARTPDALRSAVIDAIDRRDFNALSGLYNFDGNSIRSAAPVVQRLERMAKRSVLEVELLELDMLSLWGEWMSDPDVLPVLRIVQAVHGGAARVESFRLARSAGCLWLSD